MNGCTYNKNSIKYYIWPADIDIQHAFIIAYNEGIFSYSMLNFKAFFIKNNFLFYLIN